jgi:phage baseplate assembly protein W
MPRLISLPLRLDDNGAIASVDQGSDAEVDEQIAIAMLTRPGERVTVPTFGVNDPAFEGFIHSALARQLVDFGPAVTIKTVSVNKLTEGREDVVIDWTRINRLREVPTQ